MSTSDKLVTIAENVEKVYNAGYEKGKSEGSGGGMSPANYGSLYRFPNDDWAESEEVVLDLPNLAEAYLNFFYAVVFKKIKTLTVKTQKPLARATSMFQGSTGAETDSLEKLILYIDFSECTSFSAFCTVRRSLKSIEGTPIDFSSATAIGALFNYCSKLQSFRVVKETIKVDINLGANSKLDAATVQNVIEGLAPLPEGTTKNLTLYSDIANNLTEDQTNAIYAKNWQIL